MCIECLIMVVKNIILNIVVFYPFNLNFYIPDLSLFILQNSISIILMYLKIDIFFLFTMTIVNSVLIGCYTYMCCQIYLMGNGIKLKL